MKQPLSSIRRTGTTIRLTKRDQVRIDALLATKNRDLVGKDMWSMNDLLVFLVGRAFDELPTTGTPCDGSCPGNDGDCSHARTPDERLPETDFARDSEALP